MAAYEGWKVGDYAIRKNRLCQILKIHFDEHPPHVSVRMLDDDNEIGTEFSKLRHATPAEIETMIPPELNIEPKEHENSDDRSNMNSATNSEISTSTTTTPDKTTTPTTTNNTNDHDNQAGNEEIETNISKIDRMHLDDNDKDNKNDKHDHRKHNHNHHNNHYNHNNHVKNTKHDIHDIPINNKHDKNNSHSDEEARNHAKHNEAKIKINSPKSKQKTQSASASPPENPQLKKRKQVPITSSKRSPFFFDGGWDN